MASPNVLKSPEPVLSCGVKAVQRVLELRACFVGLSECLSMLACSPMSPVLQTGKPIQVFLVQGVAGTSLPNSLKFGAGM